jgi:hypothetical protein
MGPTQSLPARRTGGGTVTEPRPPGGVDATAGPRTDPFDGLAERPVAEHVAVFEAEHDRLRRELSTIDQL